MNVPIPFDELDVKNKFWKTEEWDINIPSPGFISDFILSARGIKTPTKFQVWAALWLLSSVIKRDAELEWGPLKFYFNLFVFLVGPPAIGKTSALDWADENLLGKNFENCFASAETGKRKVPRIIHSKGTSEGIFKYLLPFKTQVLEEGKAPKYIELGSSLSIIAGELATFLGRQQYNIGLIEKLTRLYDCAHIDDEVTKGNNSKDGMSIVKNPYVTLIGGITPDGMSQSIPEASFGDGFLSRVIVVFQDEITRPDPFPRIVEGAPTVDELRRRLAWVAENARGVYRLSPDAREAYIKWHSEWVDRMNNDPSLMKKAYSRYNIHLLKVSALIRANRYIPGQTIELEDFCEALKILEATFINSPEATVNVGADTVMRVMNQLRSYLTTKPGIERKKFLQYFSGRGVRARDLDMAVRELSQSGDLNIWDSPEKKHRKTFPSCDGKEFYEWAKY